MKNLMVFDLDGTLNQTEKYAVSAISDALHDFKITNLSEKDIRSTIGARDEDSIVYFFGKNAPFYKEKFWNKVYYYVETKYKDRYETYAGTKQMLIKLKENGWLIAICSNADENYIRTSLCRLKISEYFDYIQPIMNYKTKNDSLQNLLNKVKADRSIMVGDRFYDKEAAHSNHIPFVACLYGYGTAEELEGSDHFINAPLDILKIL